MEPKCEVVMQWEPNNTIAETCDAPATWRYPAMGGGYMHLCETHGSKHASISEHLVDGQWIAPTKEGA